MKRLRGIGFAALLISLVAFVNYAGDPLIHALEQLKAWSATASLEKVYLQLDKPYYAAGEDIWFKAYVVNGTDHSPSTLSSVLNVELLNQADSIKLNLKLHLDSGFAHGDFGLPDTLRAGYYHIRAYTNYMRNAGSAYFFDLPLTILNTLPSSTHKASNRPLQNAGIKKPDVQFFPEGGTLVNDLPSKIAFKSVGQNGLGADAIGTVTDDQGKIVARLKSSHLGMGVFDLKPLRGANYRANITFNDGSSAAYQLPNAVDEGYELRILSNEGSELNLGVSASGNNINYNRQLSLIAQSNGKVYYTRSFKIGSSGLNTKLSTDKIPSGIIQFTLFSSAGEPIAERLAFINNHDQLRLSLTADRSNYGQRSESKLQLTAETGNHQPVAGNFSVAVIDESKVPIDDDADNNIIARLLLTPDLKGFVEQPAYYFNHPGPKAISDLDNLMLTQGYRRFEWRQLLAGNIAPPHFTAEKDLQVSGSLLTPAGKPVSFGKVSLYDLDSIAFNKQGTADQNGRFAFTGLSFSDSTRLIIQAKTSKNKKGVDIHMDPVYPVIPSVYQYPALYAVDSLVTYAKASHLFYSKQLQLGLGNHVITLQEVVIREKKALLRNSANLNGAGNADQIIMGNELRTLGCIHITDCLEGRLLGVTFRNGIPYSTRGFRPMQLIVDGAYVDGSYLNQLNYFDVQAIEVLRNVGLTAIYGGQGGNGVLLVTTRAGNDNNEAEPIYGRGITTYYPKGYYKARQFYSPRYGRAETNKELADLRTTIYWQPDLKTKADGRASFEYFNAGRKGNYRVVVEGFDKSGRLGHAVLRYPVE